MYPDRVDWSTCGLFFGRQRQTTYLVFYRYEDLLVLSATKSHFVGVCVNQWCVWLAKWKDMDLFASLKSSLLEVLENSVYNSRLKDTSLHGGVWSTPFLQPNTHQTLYIIHVCAAWAHCLKLSGYQLSVSCISHQPVEVSGTSWLR